MKQIIGCMLLGAALLSLGCAESRMEVANSEDVWNENINEDVKEWHANGDQGMLFFMRSKSGLNTMQIWLDSGKVISSQIKAYLASLFPRDVPDNPQISPRKKIIGQWYGLDRKYDAAIVFEFKPDGDFIWESRGRVKRGRYNVGSDNAPDLVAFKTEDKGDRLVSFEFINDKALLFKQGDKKLILLKQ